jgi:8-oxo-dGTP pyrophosphatase MutT (NUDIX family)
VAAARLTSLPARMPAPPVELMPIRLDTGERRQADLPSGPGSARTAAVLVVIAPSSAAGDAEAEVILIRRVDRGGHHAGDIALPGGGAEATDQDLAATAIREATEEVGLDPAACALRVIGALETFWIPVSDYRVTPIVAVAGRRPELDAAPDEVEEIVRVPLSAFLPGSPIELVETEIRGFPLRFGAYPAGGLRVWGATARILGQLGAILGPV